MRIRSLSKTTIAPPTRSSSTVARLARRKSASSAARRWPCRRNSNTDDDAAFASEEFTEVGVARHEDPARPDCEHHDFLVPGGRKGSVALLDWIEKQTRSRIALSHVIAVRSTSNAAAIRCWGAVSVPSS